MLDEIWNIAGKVDDLEAELRFFEACGATDIQRDVVQESNGRDTAFAMLRLGRERLLLFAKPVFEEQLDEPLPLGLTHAVFEVEDLDVVLRTLADRNIEPFWGPNEVSATFGRRRIAFFRSPAGLIFEVAQPLAAVNSESTRYDGSVA